MITLSISGTEFPQIPPIFTWISRTGCGRRTKSVSAAVTPVRLRLSTPYSLQKKDIDRFLEKRNCGKTEAAQFEKVTLSSEEPVGEAPQSEVQAHQAELRKELGIVDVVLAQ